MTNHLKLSELARALDMSNGSISMAVSRGFLIRNEKIIDIDHPLNRLWIDKMISQGKTFDINRVFEKKLYIPQPKTTEPKEETQEEKPQRQGDNEESSLLLRKRKLEVKKLENEDKLARLKIEKMEGLLLPVDAAQGVFIWAIETFYNTFAQELRNLAGVLGSIEGLSHKKLIEMQRTLNESLIKIKETAKENIESGLDAKVEEYREVRGRGESK